MKAKNILVVFSVILAFLTMALAGGGGDKITICHVPPGNPANAHTISVSRNAWENGHSPHNTHSLDYIGECDEVLEPTATNTSVPTDIPNPTDRPSPVPTHVPSVTATPVLIHTQVPPTDEPSECLCVLVATVTETPTPVVLYSCQASVGDGKDDSFWITLAVGSLIGLIVGGGLVGLGLGIGRRGR